jgi:hypothetical protein
VKISEFIQRINNMLQHRPSRLAALATTAAVTLGAAPLAWAGELADRFDVHGYGFQDYLQTSRNTYLGADKRGSWDENFLGLVVAATIDNRSKVWAQLEATTGEGTRFTWFFLDYQVSDALRAHVGRVKLPLGFYNEIIDLKSSHLSALVPSIYQGDADFVHDSYHGVGADFEQDLGGGHVLWQAWAGNVYDINPPVDTRDRRAFGGRMTYDTPIDGLKLMASAYRTQVETLATAAMSSEDRAILSFEFARDNWELKSEYATHKFLGVSSSGYYIQGGYTVADKWTPYVRYDHVTLDKGQSGDPSFYQKTVALGVGYKLGKNIGLKIENHFNNGYALPVASGEVAVGAGAKKWDLFTAEVNFQF